MHNELSCPAGKSGEEAKRNEVEAAALQRIMAALEQNKPARSVDLSEEEAELGERRFADFHCVYCCWGRCDWTWEGRRHLAGQPNSACCSTLPSCTPTLPLTHLSLPPCCLPRPLPQSRGCAC